MIVILTIGPLGLTRAEPAATTMAAVAEDEPAALSDLADTTSPAASTDEPAQATNSASTTSAAADVSEPATSLNSKGAKSFAWAWPAESPIPSDKFMPNVPGLRVTGAVGVWGRAFPQSPQWPGQRNDAVWPNLEGWVKAEYTWNNGADRINFMPYGRKDFFGSRSLVDVKEGYVLHAGDGWSVLAGINTVHWGVTESRHLVNIINQVDYGWNIDGDELLGQPMANANITTPVGTLSLYGLFGFRKLHEPKVEDRLRNTLVTTSETILANDVEKNVNFAGRFNTTFALMNGSVDAAVSYFHGIGREPRYVLVPPPPPFTAAPQVASFYDLIDQGGLEVVATFDALQLKFEGIVRRQFGETYGATVAGFEYTFFNVLNSGADVGLVAEHLSDNRSALQPPTIYAHDVFLGARLSLNDSANTNFLGGILYNYQDTAQYATARLTTRIQDDLSLQLEARYFIYAPPADYLYTVLHDSFVQARVIKYF